MGVSYHMDAENLTSERAASDLNSYLAPYLPKYLKKILIYDFLVVCYYKASQNLLKHRIWGNLNNLLFVFLHDRIQNKQALK